MFDYSLDILGNEWIIIIFVALVLILGTNQLPSAARKLGRIAYEINRAKNEVQSQVKNISEVETTPNISAPLENERQKLETMAKAFGVNVAEKSDEELRMIIAKRMGQKKDESENRA